MIYLYLKKSPKSLTLAKTGAKFGHTNSIEDKWHDHSI